MKKILLTLTLILGLGFTFAQESETLPICGEGVTMIVESDEANEEFMETLTESVMSGEFGDEFLNFLADSVTYNSLVNQVVFEDVPKTEMGLYFSSVIIPSEMIGGVIGHYVQEEYNVYTMEYTWMFVNDDGAESIETVVWSFVEVEGCIVEIHGP